MNKKVIIIGPAASGKDTLKQGFIDNGFISAILHTNRNPRENEKNEVDYYFVNSQKFNNLIESNFFLVYQNFYSWLYGLSNDEWKKSNLFVLNPYMLNQLYKLNMLNDCKIIFLDIDENIRKSRFLLRSDGDISNVEKRLKSDAEQFYNFNNYDIRITNPEFNVNEIINYVN